jgi:hypothetical protein
MTWTDIALSGFFGAYGGWVVAFLATHLSHAALASLWEAVGAVLGALAGVFFAAALTVGRR